VGKCGEEATGLST